MRTLLRHPRRYLFLTFLACGFAAPGVAQFDDEFGDEFEEPAEETPVETPAEEAPSDFDDDDDNLFDDDLDEDLNDAAEDEDEVPPSDDVDEEEEDEDEAEPEELRARLFRSHNTYMGPVGGLHVVDAASGAVGTFRVQLGTEFFFTSDFIQPTDNADHIGGSLSVGWTVHEMVEIWASIQSYANSNDTGDPSLFQTLGDAQLGVKAFYRVSDVFAVGGDFSLNLLNTVGDIGLVLASTGIGLRANVTADLRGLDNPVPFVARLNFQYEIDNSSKLIEDTETARYNNLPDPLVLEDESRHLVTPVERFALSINRTDFFNIALGLEAPLRVMEDFYIHPLLEWQWRIPVNRQGYNCVLSYDPATTDGPPPGVDDCRADSGIGANPMTLTLGARVLPPVKGLSILLAADIGLTGTSTLVRELAPNAPYNIYIGMSYAYDTVEPEPVEAEVREVERRVEVQLPPPLQGRIKGQIVEQGAGTAIAGATIRFQGQDLTGQISGDDGRFTTYQFAPGQITMELTHPEYAPGQCAATIPDERPEEGELEVEVRCELVALPRVGGVTGTISSADGGAVGGATIALSGPATRSVSSGPDGRFTIQNLPPGTYQVRVDAENFLIKTDTVAVVARESVSPTVTLVPRPARALVRVRNRDIQIRRQINFATNSADILPSSEPLMTEIADVLIRNTDVTVVEIQGHTDNRGRSAANMTLSQNRADSVRAWLVAHGVAATRLQARGYGDTNPLVPNITPSNRARNRRVQFIIESRVEIGRAHV